MTSSNRLTLPLTFVAVMALFTALSGQLEAQAIFYEPFDYDTGNINGEAGTGDGMTGNWGSNRNGVIAGDLTFGNLATTMGTNSGGKTNDRAGGGSGILHDGIVGAGLLNDGATLWFSALVDATQNGGGRAYVGIGTGRPDGFDRYDDQGLGLLVDGTALRAEAWPTGGGAQKVTSATPLDAGTNLIVGKITWGATGELIELYTPDSNDLSDPGSVMVSMMTNSNFDQAGTSNAADLFDTIGYAGTGDPTLQDTDYLVDEIRFGASYADVVPLVAVPEPASIAIWTLLGLGLAGFGYYRARRTNLRSHA